jgi:uncharacterized protein
MRLSEDKINHLAHLIAYALDDAEQVKIKGDLNRVRLRIKEILTRELEIEDEVDQAIRERMRRRKKILEGSDEWDIIYRQEFEAEMKKRQR